MLLGAIRQPERVIHNNVDKRSCLLPSSPNLLKKRIGPLVELSELSALLPLRGGVQATQNCDQTNQSGPIAVSEDQVAGHDQKAATDQEYQHDHRNPVWWDQLPPFLLRGVARGRRYLVVIGGRVAGCGTIPRPSSLRRDATATRLSFRRCHLRTIIGDKRKRTRQVVEPSRSGVGVWYPLAALQEVPHEVVALVGEDAFGMELHPLDIKFAVANSHDHAVRTASGDSKHIGNGVGIKGKGVVPGCSERRWQTSEHPATVVLDRRSFAMH